MDLENSILKYEPYKEPDQETYTVDRQGTDLCERSENSMNITQNLSEVNMDITQNNSEILNGIVVQTNDITSPLSIEIPRIEFVQGGEVMESRVPVLIEMPEETSPEDNNVPRGMPSLDPGSTQYSEQLDPHECDCSECRSFVQKNLFSPGSQTPESNLSSSSAPYENLPDDDDEIFEESRIPTPDEKPTTSSQGETFNSNKRYNKPKFDPRPNYIILHGICPDCTNGFQNREANAPKGESETSNSKCGFPESSRAYQFFQQTGVAFLINLPIKLPPGFPRRTLGRSYSLSDVSKYVYPSDLFRNNRPKSAPNFGRLPIVHCHVLSETKNPFENKMSEKSYQEESYNNVPRCMPNLDPEPPEFVGPLYLQKCPCTECKSFRQRNLLMHNMQISE